MSYFDNINPYDIIDGPWGGMGIATWFNDFDPENPKDVYELDWVVDSNYSETEEKWTYWYSRFYDYSEKVWKPTDSSNNKKHIVFKEKRKPIDKIILPRVNRTFPELNLSDILQYGTMKSEPIINSNFYIPLTFTENK
jgi:hypothetical protein